MANERDDEELGEKKEFGQDRQQPTSPQGQEPIGQQGEQPLGQQGQQPIGQQAEFGQQGQPKEFGQQGQSSTGQAEPGRSGETETLSTERGFGQGAGGSGAASGGEGVGGFVGSQATGSDALLREEGSTADFASEGQGALEGQDEDVETGQRRNPDSDIEGGTGA